MLSLVFGGLCLIAVAVIIYGYLKYVHNAGAKRQQEFEEQTKLLKDIREVITSYILNEGVHVFNAIAKQKIILHENNREAIAIFLSTDQFKYMLAEVFQTHHLVDDMTNAILDLGMPVGFIGELPIYVSDYLNDAPVFVAGGIHWDLDG